MVYQLPAALFLPKGHYWASPPYSPVLLLGLLISSLRVPFFLRGLAKVGGREACPCACSNTTRGYHFFPKISGYPKDLHTIVHIFSFFVGINIFPSPVLSSFLGDTSYLWSSLGIEGYISHWQTKIWWVNMYLAYFWEKTCTVPIQLYKPAIPAMTIDQLPNFFWLKEHGTKVLHQLQAALQKKDAQTSRPENAWFTMGGFGDLSTFWLNSWGSLGSFRIGLRKPEFYQTYPLVN